MDATDRYKAGAKSAISNTALNLTVDSSGKTATGTVSTSDVSDTKTITGIDVSAAYDIGKNDGAKSLSIFPTENQTLDYGASKTIYAYTAGASGVVVTRSVIITAPADRYSEGVDDGASSVTVPNTNIVRQTMDAYVGGSDYATTVSIRASASNGAYGTQSFSVSGKSAYNVGKNAGANSLTLSPANNETLDYGISKTITATTTNAVGTAVTKSVTITAPADRYNDGASDSITNDLANTAKTNAVTAQTKADSAYNLADSKPDSLSDLDVTATAIELNYLSGVTSNVQTQLDSKSASGHTHDDRYYTEAEIDAQLSSKADKIRGVYYIEGAGTTDITNKVATWTGSHSDISEYYAGLMIAYKISTAGSTKTTLNINNLGAVTVVKNATSAISTSYAVNSVILLVYTVDGETAYWKAHDYDANTRNSVGDYRKNSTKLYFVGTASSDSSTTSSYATSYTNSNIYVDTSNVLNSAQGFKGALVGNADTATSATKATQDGSGNTITTTYETKTDATAKLTEAKTYTDTVIASLSDTFSKYMNEEYSDTLIWDGDVTGRAAWSVGSAAQYVKVSDQVLSLDDLSSGCTMTVKDDTGAIVRTVTFDSSDTTIFQNNYGFTVDLAMYSGLAGGDAPEDGTYFIKFNTGAYASSLTINEYSGFGPNETLKHEHIPTTVPIIKSAAAGDVVAVSSVDENGKPISWKTISGVEWLIGSTDDITPAQATEALRAGRDVLLTHTDSTYGTNSFTGFMISETNNTILVSGILVYNGTLLSAILAGSTTGTSWFLTITPVAKSADIPTTLPNPNALTFTGAMSGSYDGSSSMTIEVPVIRTPVRGEDYWTEDDKAYIIDQVLAAVDASTLVHITVDENNNITLYGADDGAYTLRYENEDGTTTELCALTISDGTGTGNGDSGGTDEPVVTYTNLVPTALTPTDLTSVFNTTGYMDGAYASSSSPYYGSDSATVCTGVIPVSASADSVFYIKGITLDASVNSHCRVGIGQAHATNGGANFSAVKAVNQMSSFATLETLGDQYYKLTILASYVAANTTRQPYIFLSGVGTGANLIVTANEPIE